MHTSAAITNNAAATNSVIQPDGLNAGRTVATSLAPALAVPPPPPPTAHPAPSTRVPGDCRKYRHQPLSQHKGHGRESFWGFEQNILVGIFEVHDRSAVR
jgi:hypothetical protein